MENATSPAAARALDKPAGATEVEGQQVEWCMLGCDYGSAATDVVTAVIVNSYACLIDDEAGGAMLSAPAPALCQAIIFVSEGGAA